MKTTIFSAMLFAFLFSYSLNAQSNCNVTTTIQTGTGTHVTSQYSYINCHRYVRTALLNDGVDMNTGNFVSNPSIHSNQNSLSSDDQFVIVCDKNDAEAIDFNSVDNQPDHSVLVLDGGVAWAAFGDFASTPGAGSAVYKHSHASTGSGGGTEFNYFAVMPGLEGPSSISYQTTEEFCVKYKNFMQSIVWEVSSPSLSIVGSNTSFCVDILSNCSAGGGTFKVKATVTIKGTGEIRTFEKNVTVSCPTINNCEGSLNGGPLYTFNYVAPGVTHTIQMNQSGWSWNINSGTPNLFQVLNSGQTVKINIAKGCVALRAFHPTCGTRYFVFCPGAEKVAPDNRPQYRKNDDQGLENAVLDIEVYPNPASEVVYLRNDNSQNYQIRIFNELGQLIGQHQNENQISLNHVENGTYYFEVQDMDTLEKVIKRIIVIH